jgi:hypothetical protein
MSIAVLSQVFTEARRLTIAGSVVAPGDFRLKKLVPSLEQAGKQAPVFAKVAEAAKAVIDGTEESSAAALLELTSLVNAVLYTQGETGITGKLEPVETTDLGGRSTQMSARVLKPLLEALSSTGSGRYEQIKEAFDRGLFWDLRLVKPALGALDDPYSEIAELISNKVLPMYGKAILPELQAKYDPKGTKGHPRRLKLMHSIDPEGTRPLVKAALDQGSKEVRVVAVSCLGSEAEDLDFLIDQAAAKAQDVRAAAYEALALIDNPRSIELLRKGLTSKDYSLVSRAIQESKRPKLVDLLVDEIRRGVVELLKTKDKKQTGIHISRLVHLITSLPREPHPAEDDLLLELFSRREELTKLKGDTLSGADLIEAVIAEMASGSIVSKRAIVDAHAEVPADQLPAVLDAACEVLTPAEVYDTFSPYLTAKVDEKKKGKDPAWERREALIEGIESDAHLYYLLDDEEEYTSRRSQTKKPEYDPRWLDLALASKRLEFVSALAKPGHPGAMAFAKTMFDEKLKKAKIPHDLHLELAFLFRVRHPDATEAFFAVLGKRNKKSHFYHYWFTRMVPHLSKDAIPRLEEMLAGMSDNEANYWIDAIHELRTKA